MCSTQQMIIEVQHCVDCHLHNWCSRHNEAKYHDFFHKLEVKAKNLIPHPRIIKNAPPAHYQPRNMAATAGLQVHHYFDEEAEEEVAFPRHGAFEVKVNGILIFSKLQSNLWPNLQKIAGMLAQMKTEVEGGRDISKFSLVFRQESNRQELAETYKKLIAFKINKRPHSSQFNAGSYLPKGSLEHSPEIKQERFKRKNVTSLKKGGIDAHRKSDVARKPLIRLTNSKVEAANLYCEFPQPKNEDHCQLPEVGRIVKNEYCSSHSKKKIQFKDDALQLIRAQPFLVITNNSSAMKLEKKPSRKLILKLNEKKSENSPHVTHKYSANFEDSSVPSDQVMMGGANPSLLLEIPTKKSFKSLKSVISIGEKLGGKTHNEIKIEDYTGKQIKKTDERDQRKGIHAQKASVFQQISHTQKLVKQYAKPKEESFEVRPRQQSIEVRPKEEQLEAIMKEQPLQAKAEQLKQQKVQQQSKQEQTPALVQKAQLPKDLQSIHSQIGHNQAKRQEQPVFKREIENPAYDYEEEVQDQLEQPEEQARPQSSSSRRMYREEQAIGEEELLEYQQPIESNLSKKGNLTAAKANQQQYEEEEYAERVQKMPVQPQDPPQEPLFQEKYEESSPIYEQSQKIQEVAANREQDVEPSREYNLGLAQNVCLPYDVTQVGCSAAVPEESPGDFKLDEPQSLLLSSQEGEQVLRVEKAEVEASISRMEHTILNSIIDKQPTVSGSISQSQQLAAAIQQTRNKDVPTAEEIFQFKEQQMEQPSKYQQNRQQPQKWQKLEAKPQAAIVQEDQKVAIVEEEQKAAIVERDHVPMGLHQQSVQKEKKYAIQNRGQQYKIAAEAATIPEATLTVQRQQPNEEPSPVTIENELEDRLQLTPPDQFEQKPDIESFPQDQPLREEEPILNETPQQAPLNPVIQQHQKDIMKQEQNEPISNSTAKVQQIQAIHTEENAPQPIHSLRQSLQQQPHYQGQVALPSIHQLSIKQTSRDPQTFRSIPNATQSSIGLSSQIHFELNNVYELIQARVHNRASLDQWEEEEGEQEGEEEEEEEGEQSPL